MTCIVEIYYVKYRLKLDVGEIFTTLLAGSATCADNILSAQI